MRRADDPRVPSAGGHPACGHRLCVLRTVACRPRPVGHGLPS
jgi:hypothetical protein